MSSVSRSLRVIPPKTSYFSVGLGQRTSWICIVAYLVTDVAAFFVDTPNYLLHFLLKGVTCRDWGQQFGYKQYVSAENDEWPSLDGNYNYKYCARWQANGFFFTYVCNTRSLVRHWNSYSVTEQDGIGVKNLSALKDPDLHIDIRNFLSSDPPKSFYGSGQTQLFHTYTKTAFGHVLLPLMFGWNDSSATSVGFCHDLGYNASFPMLHEGQATSPKSYESQASVSGASNKLDYWLSDWVRDFTPLASSAMEAAKQTKFGTKVA